jgi:hypothetical protein
MTLMPRLVWHRIHDRFTIDLDPVEPMKPSISYTRNEPLRALCISSKAVEALESLGRKRRIETGSIHIGQDMAGTAGKMVVL